MTMLTGLDAKAYYGTAGSPPSTLITKAKDVKWSVKNGIAESSSRAARWKNKKSTLGEGDASLSLDWDSANAEQIALQAAALAGTLLAFKFIDAGSGKGIWADGVISGFDANQPLTDGQTVDLKVDFSGAITAV